MSLLRRFRPLLLSNLLTRANVQAFVHKRLLYEQTRSGSMDLEMKKLKKRLERREMDVLKEQANLLKNDIKWSWETIKDALILPFSSDNRRFQFEDQEVIKFWDFNQANNSQISSFPLPYKMNKLNDMDNWFCTCDADYDLGFSKASFTASPSGHALFSGYIDKTLPTDGKVARTGYAYVGSYKARKPFSTWGTHPDFEGFTHIVLRVRGDGRRYFIVFDTSDQVDISWFDRHQFMLFTHGGPYWQYVRIPLNRFFFQYKGYLQDIQYRIQPQLIRNVGILISDIYSGPFSLEIDYIGFMHDSQYHDTLEYESYYIESSPYKSLGGL